MQHLKTEFVLRRRTKFADPSISAGLYRSSVGDVKPLEDSVSKAICIRQDFACGVEAYKVRKSMRVGPTCVLIVVMKLPTKLQCNASNLRIFLV